MRTVFLGSDPIALPLLDWLADGEGRAHAQLAAVYTQPDRPVGRGQKIQPNAIKAWALARNLPVFQPEKLTPAARGEFAALAPDLALVMAYGHILRDDFIATPRFGTLNLHASLLPAWRGASPIQTAIASGGRETGVSLMRIVRQLDAGPVADVERVAIAPLDTALDVEQKLAAACVPLLARALPRLREGALSFTPQDDANASYCRRLVKSDGALDFREPAATLAARINGLYPWPACSVEINDQPVKFGLAGVLDGENAAAPTMPAPGEVLPPASDTLHIATGAGILHILRLQRPGGKMLPASDFLRGFPIHPGTILPSTAMPSLAAEPRGSGK
ncbi:methionyl-tRNA formyltransferase [Termitidicoccus mucosus]|uniref:Methionyl-tRNA formyltransferase n=1 Tax=Termitidicoccus mucosus TaxID=1184151 RepID=A0A178IDB2_9BACT|nr:methionyl-tRNA formyltransferase [Opitutaceae bacterium TSB47]